jgi:hypothetical protein
MVHGVSGSIRGVPRALAVVIPWVSPSLSKALVSFPEYNRGKAGYQDREELAMSADPELLFDGPTDASRTIALAHGAGAAMDSPFLTFFATGLGKQGIQVARFEYPYMASKRSTGKTKPPDREPILRET